MGLIYSTNSDFLKQHENSQKLLPGQQNLIVQRSSKGRGGKTVTIISGFTGKTEDLETLAKLLKQKCGTGGSVKDGEILMQGDVRQKISEILKKEGYRFKLSGG